MKNIGIVRRIDHLGRIVIPKEVRSRMCIHENDPLEIYIENDKVILKKFSLLEDMSDIGFMLNGFYKTFKCPVIICDCEKVVQAFNVPKDITIGLPITQELIEIINARQAVLCSEKSAMTPIVAEAEAYMLVMHPIITSGCDIYGAVVMIATPSRPQKAKDEMALGAKLMAAAIAEYLTV